MDTKKVSGWQVLNILPISHSSACISMFGANWFLRLQIESRKFPTNTLVKC